MRIGDFIKRIGIAVGFLTVASYGGPPAAGKVLDPKVASRRSELTKLSKKFLLTRPSGSTARLARHESHSSHSSHSSHYSGSDSGHSSHYSSSEPSHYSGTYSAPSGNSSPPTGSALSSPSPSPGRTPSPTPSPVVTRRPLETSDIDNGSPWGWLGFLGVLGLFGFVRRKKGNRP